MQSLRTWREICDSTEGWRRCHLSPDQRRAKRRMLERVAETLSQNASLDDPVSVWWVPGRVEVLGKHTDYAGGRSLTSALEWGMVLAARPRPDGHVHIRDVAREVACDFPFSAEVTASRGSWTLYPRTVARRLARDFPASEGGADIVLAGDLPSAAGLSSSSVLVVGIALLLADVLELRRQPRGEIWDDALRCAEYLACVESGRQYCGLSSDRGVGTRGGSQDHIAILDSRAGHVSEFSYRPARLRRRRPLPEGCLWAIASSGVKAPKTGSARQLYNRLSDLAGEAIDLWNRHTGRQDPHLSAVLARGSEDGTRLGRILERGGGRFTPQDLLRRLNHLQVETALIESLPERLDAEGLQLLGSLVDRSQRAAEDLLQNQVPETVHLARSARRLGACAASGFGAGFGGAVWALIESGRAQAFLQAWKDDYRSAFPQRHQARFLTSLPASPATRLTR
ncbi:MAG TPA: galactokinase family protein [Acidobacteriota bacterium]|nr:galactokinase family protein [Acidobacteriota bacterium]